MLVLLPLSEHVSSLSLSLSEVLHYKKNTSQQSSLSPAHLPLHFFVHIWTILGKGLLAIVADEVHFVFLLQLLTYRCASEEILLVSVAHFVVGSKGKYVFLSQKFSKLVVKAHLVLAIICSPLKCELMILTYTFFSCVYSATTVANCKIFI
jgi:hypothetical protein